MILSGVGRNVQAAAARALGLVGNNQPHVVVNTLLKMLSSSTWYVRDAAALALGLLGNGHPQVVEILLESLSNPDRNVRGTTALALGLVGSGHPQVVEALLKALGDTASDVQEASTAALAFLPIDSSAIGTSLEEMLLKYELIASKQFTADNLQSSLLFSLQQVFGEI